MKFKLILFTLLIRMMSFAGIRAETPDLEKSSIITPDSLSIDMAVSQVMNVSNVLTSLEQNLNLMIKQVVLQDLNLITDTGIFEFEEHTNPAMIQSTHPVTFSKQFFRKPRDGFRCK